MSSIFKATPTNLFENAVELIENDFVAGDLATVADTYSLSCNSDVNINLRAPATKIYPKKSTKDAPYSLTETQLRQVIQIPPTFTYGKVRPHHT